MKRCKDCIQLRPNKAFKSGIGICDGCLEAPQNVRLGAERRARRAALTRVKYPEIVIVQECRRVDRKRGHTGNDLDHDFVRIALKRPCTYCGTTNLKMTLDRINNDLAHTKSNTVPACLRCNYMRGSMPFPAWKCLIPGIREALARGLFGDWRSQPLNKKHSTATEEVEAFDRLTKAEVSAVRRATCLNPPRFDWPPTEDLAAEVQATSLRAVAARLGCSHVAVGKRLGRYRKLA